MLERGALILQHGATGPPGVLGAWLAERGIPARVVDLRGGEDPPDPAEFDFVASLGSEFSVNDGEPWIAVERQTLDRAVARDVPVLGLCFGGQSLAVSLGGEVAPMPTTEVGWLHLDSEDTDLIPSGPWLQHHRERFRGPRGGGAHAWRAGRGRGAGQRPAPVGPWAAEVGGAVSEPALPDRAAMLELAAQEII